MNTTMNVTNQTQESYGPEKTSTALLWVALVHCYCVAVMGTLGNTVALWCITTCKKTLQPMKVMLFSVFVPALVICLATRPVVGELLLSRLTHDPHRVSRSVANTSSVVYSVLAQTELAAIAAVAVVRAVSVWAPRRPQIELRGTVLLVIGISVYSILTGVGLEGLMMLGKIREPWTVTLITILFFLNTTLPALITAVAYSLMIYVIQRNKRRLANSQQQARAATAMDQATRAMLAVFISNLVFGLPHSIYHLMGRQPYYMHVIFHVLFSTHFVVDPLAFVGFNSGFRRQVFSGMRKVTQSIAWSTTSSVLADGPVSRNDNLKSSTNKQEGISV